MKSYRKIRIFGHFGFNFLLFLVKSKLNLSFLIQSFLVGRPGLAVERLDVVKMLLSLAAYTYPKEITLPPG